MEETKNQGQNPVGQNPDNQAGVAPNSQNLGQNNANTPNYPISEEMQAESAVRPSARVILRTVMVVLIVAAAVWFFSRGDDKQPAGNVLSESENNNAGSAEIVAGQNGGSTVIGEADSQDIADGQVNIVAFFAKNGDEQCDRVYPLTRAIEKKYDAETVNALRGLLTPLTAAETGGNFTTKIPAGIYLMNVFVSGDGLATVKLSSAFSQAADGCFAQTARAQIEQTMLQFPYVKAVRICAGDICE